MPSESEPMPIVRRASQSDHADLLELIEQFCRVDGHDFDIGRIDAGLLPLLHDDTHGQVWLLGERPVGYAVITWSWSLESGGRDCLLDEIYIAQRGQGLGTHFIAEVVNHARTAGAAAMFLETEAPNDRARRFYQRNGFKAEGSIWLSRNL